MYKQESEKATTQLEEQLERQNNINELLQKIISLPMGGRKIRVWLEKIVKKGNLDEKIIEECQDLVNAFKELNWFQRVIKSPARRKILDNVKELYELQCLEAPKDTTQ